MQYHLAVRNIEKNKDIIRADKMASNRSNDKWREAKKMRGKNNCLPELVDNVSGEENIAELFGNKFEGILTLSDMMKRN